MEKEIEKKIISIDYFVQGGGLIIINFITKLKDIKSQTPFTKSPQLLIWLNNMYKTKFINKLHIEHILVKKINKSKVKVTLLINFNHKQTL